MNIEGCVALVTGANRGIGDAFVRELIAAGAKHVYVGARDLDNAKPLLSEFPADISAVQLDVSKVDEIETAVEQCSDVNLLVNNAGVFNHQTLLSAPDMSALRNEMEVNFFAPIAMTRAFAPSIERNGGGAIVNVLSWCDRIGARNGRVQSFEVCLAFGIQLFARRACAKRHSCGLAHCWFGQDAHG